MSPTAPSRLARFTRAALPAAPLALGAIPSAQAQIVYTNANITLSANDGKFIYVDMGTGGTGGTAAFGNPGTPSISSPTFYLFFRYNANNPEWASNNTTVFSGNNEISHTGSGNVVSKLAFNTTISGTAGLNLGGNYANFAGLGASVTPWSPGTTGFVGLRFDTTTTPLFGWAQLSYNVDQTLTLHDFAYEASGGAILAGAIPEPSTAALLGLGALVAGSAALYRRRQKNKAT